MSTSEPTSALARLALSRERMRAVMLASRPPRRPARTSGDPPERGSWFDFLKHIPGAEAAIDTVSVWWRQQPLRATAIVAGEASNALLRPVAQRNPLALAAVGLVLGAVLVRFRPWRWVVKPALFAGLLPQLVSRVVGSLPIESWVNVLMRFIDGTAPRPTGGGTASAGGGDAPPAPTAGS